jgi:hypothetical protein
VTCETVSLYYLIGCAFLGICHLVSFVNHKEEKMWFWFSSLCIFTLQLAFIQSILFVYGWEWKYGNSSRSAVPKFRLCSFRFPAFLVPAFRKFLRREHGRQNIFGKWKWERIQTSSSLKWRILLWKQGKGIIRVNLF